MEEFGYWQLFIFYIGYVGIFHFGLSDGVYLINGGKARSRIDKKDINTQFWLMCFVQVVLAAGLGAVALIGPFNVEREFVLVMTAVMIVVNNAGLYWGYVCQAMNETKSFSVSVLIDSLSFLLPLCLLLFVGEGAFQPYIVFYTIAKCIRLAYCLVKCRDFLAIGIRSIHEGLALCRGSVLVGVKLLIANTTGALILGVIRFLIDANWGIEEFSSVSFSLSLVSFFILFVSQASMVLFPSLRQAGMSEVKRFFLGARRVLSCVLPVAYVLYGPICWILGIWLPEYGESFSLFALLLPLCVFDGRMDIVGTTYLKVLRKEGLLLWINVCALLISAAGAVIGAYALHSIDFMVLSATLAIAWRCLYTEHLVSKELGMAESSCDIASMVLAVASVGSNTFFGGAVGFFISLGAYLMFLFVRRSDVRNLRTMLSRLKRNA